MPATYTTTQLTADAQNACYSYGLTPGSASYDRCVGREVEARRYRQEAVVTPAPATYPCGRRSTPRCNSSVTVTPAATTPPAGVQAFRDEYGFRYDGQGNRIDRNGNIISPQSTSPLNRGRNGCETFGFCNAGRVGPGGMQSSAAA